MSLHGAGPAIRVSRLVWGALCRGGGGHAGGAEGGGNDDAGHRLSK